MVAVGHAGPGGSGTNVGKRKLGQEVKAVVLGGGSLSRPSGGISCSDAGKGSCTRPAAVAKSCDGGDKLQPGKAESCAGDTGVVIGNG